MLGACSDHVGLGDWYMCIFRHLLEEFFLFNVKGESSAGVDWFIEFVKVGVDLGLVDCCVVSHDIVIDIADGDPIETLIGVLECSEHPFVEHGGSDVGCDAPCVDVLGPVDMQYLVFVSEAFALVRIHTGNYFGIRWGCIGGWVLEVSIISVEKSGAWSMHKWTFPLPQFCGVLTAIRFMQICLNQVRIAEYVGSPKILWMTLWEIIVSTLSRETSLVTIIAPVRRLTPFIRFVVLVVFL